MLIVIVSFITLFVLSIYVMDSPSNKPSPEIDKITKVVKNKGQITTTPKVPDSLVIEMKEDVQSETGKVIQTKDGKMVVTGVLPPELRELNKNLNKINKTLEAAITQDQKKNELKDMQQLIQETDDLITRTNLRLGITSPSL